MSTSHQTTDGKFWKASLAVGALAFAGMIVFAGLRLLEQAHILGDLPDAQSLAALQQNNAAVLALALAALLLVASGGLTVIALRRLRAAQAQQMQAEIQRQLADSTARINQDVTRLKTILDGMPDGILYTEDNRIRYANRVIAHMIGYDGSESEADTTNRLAGLYQSLSSLIGHNGKSRGVFTIRRKDGSEFDARVTHLHLDGTGVVTIIQDNSPEKVLQAQKLRFVSNASHELRTPIANLKTRLYLLRRQPEKMTEHLDVVEQVISKMQQLIEEMFDFTEMERGVMLLEREDVALQDLVTEVIESYQARAERRSLTLECDLAPEPLTVFVDRKRFVQVMANLVSSAMSHTREGGHIRVSVAQDMTAKTAIIQLQDNGVGIAPDLLEQVFQPFSLAKHGDLGGTALGLTLSKEIIELHGGDITAASEAGKGTAFTVRLPLAA